MSYNITIIKHKKMNQEEKTTNNDNNSKEYISKEGHKALQAKLEELKGKRRMEIAARLEYAKSLGDLSENSEYQDAKEEQMVNETHIAEMEDFLSRAEIIKEPRSSSKIVLGSTLLVSSSVFGVERYTITGKQESDPQTGHISHESPLGKGLIGKEKGDSIAVHTPKGNVEYVIIDIV
ncbi:transcription elongation factor GreA [Patescibacteria group bacterium]